MKPITRYAIKHGFRFLISILGGVVALFSFIFLCIHNQWLLPAFLVIALLGLVFWTGYENAKERYVRKHRFPQPDVSADQTTRDWFRIQYGAVDITETVRPPQPKETPHE